MNQTWLAYAAGGDGPRQGVEAALARVAGHYQQLSERPLVRHGFAGSRLGAVIWHEPEPRCRWPAWSTDGTTEVTTAYVPTGWERVVGDLPPERAAMPLARALVERPAVVAQLNAPFVLGVCEMERENLTILNDAFGAARLYEMEFRGGVVWSNRLGALPLFAGIAPDADPRGWALFAAGGWFMGDSTPIRGARKVGPGTAIGIDRSGVRHTRTDSIAEVVTPHGPNPATREAAADQASALMGTAYRLWNAAPDIDLSGGRDSRIGAAAAVAQGIDAVFNTTDDEPGEADITRTLAALAPRPMHHVVTKREKASPTDTLQSRTLAMHLAHDGVTAPDRSRRSTPIPYPPPAFAVISGHGGEVAHGFLYGSPAGHRRVRRGGDRGALRRIMRFCRRTHQAARPGAYDLTRREIKATLATGQRYGLERFALLSFFYLVDRFPYKSGVNVVPNKLSVFSTPAFMRASFDLSTKERSDNVIHRELVARLVPEWSDVPFYKRKKIPMPTQHRERIWETEDADALDAIIGSDGSWTEVFEPAQVRQLWAEARSGGGHAHNEQVFERVACRAFYDEHLDRLARQATADSPAGPPSRAPSQTRATA